MSSNWAGPPPVWGGCHFLPPPSSSSPPPGPAGGISAALNHQNYAKLHQLGLALKLLVLLRVRRTKLSQSWEWSSVCGVVPTPLWGPSLDVSPSWKSGMKPLSSSTAVTIVQMFFIYITAAWQQRDLLWGIAFLFQFGVSGTRLRCVPMCHISEGWSIFGNLPWEAQHAEYLRSVSGDGSTSLLTCGCIYRAPVLIRQGTRGEGERICLAVLLAVQLRRCG